MRFRMILGVSRVLLPPPLLQSAGFYSGSAQLTAPTEERVLRFPEDCVCCKALASFSLILSTVLLHFWVRLNILMFWKLGSVSCSAVEKRDWKGEKSSHLLVYSSYAHSSQGLTNLKPGGRNSGLVSCEGGRDPVIWAFACHLLDSTLARNWNWLVELWDIECGRLNF